MWHRLPKFDELLRIGGSDNSSHRAISAFTNICRGQLLDVRSDAAIDCFAVADDVLQKLATRIGGLHQDENTSATFARDLDKWRKTIVAQIRAHRQGVGMPDTSFATQIPTRVSLGRATNVVSFPIDDHQEAACLGVHDDVRHSRHPARAQLFEKGGLHFHDRHNRGHHVDYAVAKTHISVGYRRCRCAATTPEGLGQLFPARIETHANSIAGELRSSRQTISKMIQSTFSQRQITLPRPDYRCFTLIRKPVWSVANLTCEILPLTMNHSLFQHCVSKGNLMRRWMLLAVIILLVPSSVFAQAKTKKPKRQSTPRLEPKVADFEYAHDSERQRFDFWQAKSDKPTPVVLLIHGGGWMGGDKSRYRTAQIQPFLDAGISVAAINYRFIPQAMEQNIEPPVKAPLTDAARALQTIRSKAKEWNIDPTRVGSTGSSAGACTSLWLALHDNLAKPDSSNPIERESTRLTCAAVVGRKRRWTRRSYASGFPMPSTAGTRSVSPAREDSVRTSLSCWW